MFSLRPVKGESFINREKLMEDIMYDLKNSFTGYALYGRRRIGKTSIFKEVQRRLEEEEDIVAVYFSVWDLMNDKLSNFIRDFTVAVLDAYKHHLTLKYKARNLLKASFSLLKEILRELNISIKIKDEVEFLLSFDESKANYDKLVEDCWNLPEELAKETNTKCVLLIDEFPALMNLKDGKKVGESFIKKIRTIHEDQEHVVLCISGSIRHTMKIVTINSASAFYGQFIVKEVGPLEKKYASELLIKNLSYISEDAIDEVYDFSRGIPFYVQFLGKIMEKRERITLATVKEAEDEFIEEEGDIVFKDNFDNLGSKEREVLVAIAKGLQTPSKIAKEIKTVPNAISVYLGYLEEKGYIAKKGKGFYVIEDPVFENWLKRKVL